jgi:ribonucleotide monophosphatase NagD (HAD superfamily)
VVSATCIFGSGAHAMTVSPVRAILFDLDGVLYQGDSAIPGAPQTLDWVRGQGIPHLFLTNTTPFFEMALQHAGAAADETLMIEAM